MSVLVDSSVWSLGLRRLPANLSDGELLIVDEWEWLIKREEVRIIGPIKQELLSGIRHQA